MNLINNLSWVALRFGFFFLMLYLVAPAHAQNYPIDPHYQEFQDALNFLTPLEGRYEGKLTAAGDGNYTTPPKSCDDFRIEIVGSDLSFTNLVEGHDSWTISLVDSTRRQKSAWAQLQSDHNSVTSVWTDDRDLVVERWTNQTSKEGDYTRSKETFSVQKRTDGSGAGTLGAITYVRMDYRGRLYRPGSWIPRFHYMKCKVLN